MADGKGKWIGALALAAGLALAFLVFAQGITTGHVGLDDWGYTSGCPFVRGGLTWKNVARAFGDFGYGAIWMPVTFASYMLDVSLFGDSWKAYHAVNVGLHLVNAVLAYLLFLRLVTRSGNVCDTARMLICALAATLWAVHPLRAEAVTFVASRKEELWTMFALLGMLAFDSFLTRRTVLRLAGVTVFFVLALLSKPTALCIPFLLLAVAFFTRRLDRKVFLALLPLFALSLAAGFVTLHSQSHPTAAASVDVFETTFAWRVLNAVVSLGLYAWYTVWPAGIHMDYRAVFNGWPVDGGRGIAVFALAVLAGGVVFFRLKEAGRRRLLGLAALFLFSIGPTLGVFGYVNGDQAMADRYSYFPHIALFLGVAEALMAVSGKAVVRRIALGLGCALAIGWAFWAVPVVRAYETGFTACSRALEKDPDNWRALRIVGNEYCARLGRMDEGIGMLRKSFRLRRSKFTADSLAYVLALRGAAGDFAEVKRLGASAAKAPQTDEGGMMLDALGIVSMREGAYPRAAFFFAEGLKSAKRNHSPDWSWLYLGQCLANCGRRREAERVLRKAAASRLPTVANRARSALRDLAAETVRFEWSDK